MHAETRIVPTSKGLLWAGRALSTLSVLFLAFDAVAKVLMVAPVVEASRQLGLPVGAIPGIGIVLLACTALYALPRTAVLGAVLLTGYLGGAVATHVLTSGPVFSVVFPVLLGVVVWGGLYLREPRLHALIPLR
jgi:hypothetical protein